VSRPVSWAAVYCASCSFERQPIVVAVGKRARGGAECGLALLQLTVAIN